MSDRASTKCMYTHQNIFWKVGKMVLIDRWKVQQNAAFSQLSSYLLSTVFEYFEEVIFYQTVSILKQIPDDLLNL